MATRKKAASSASDLLVGFALDRSSSMAGLAQATIDGFNQFRADQLAQQGKTWLSLVLFSTDFETRYVAADLSTVPEMSAVEGPNIYRAYGNTALYDAVGITIEGLAAWHRNHPEFQGKTLVVAMTDGGENSSLQWSLERVNRAIADAQAKGWTFSFLGAGEAAWLEGRKFSTIRQDAVINYAPTAMATAGSFNTLSASTSTYRGGGGFSTAGAAADSIGWSSAIGNTAGTAQQASILLGGGTSGGAPAAPKGRPTPRPTSPRTRRGGSGTGGGGKR